MCVVNFGGGALYVCVILVPTVSRGMCVRVCVVNFGGGALYVCVILALTVPWGMCV